jgi:hypothetical protein
VPQDLGRGDRRPGHDLDLSVDACGIRVDLQEDIADPQRGALRMGDDDFDLLHGVDHCLTAAEGAGMLRRRLPNLARLATPFSSVCRSK